jgi:signal transduction histidine kinase
MDKKNVVSAPKETIAKLKVSAKKKEATRGKLAVKAKTLRLKAEKLATTAKKKEGVRGRLVVTAEKLATTAKEKETVRGNLAVAAKKLALVAKEKEIVRSKLAVTAETLRLKAKQLAVTAKEKESIKNKLEVTAKQLALVAKEKESVRSKLAVTAETLRLKAKQLAVTAKEKEVVRSKLEVTAKKLAVVAKEVELANKELRELDLAKDEFVSIASHQLRTPLTALKGYTGMLLDEDAGPINDKQREYLKEIKNANDRMIDLITALLNVSRVDLGVFVVEPESVDLKKVAESVLSELEMKIKEKGLKMSTSFEKNIPLVKADLKITRMIFQNLLTNAVKYTPARGSVSLNIKKDGSAILISVSDTGYGIPEDAQSKIFTKMFRADNARLKDPSGTGLGLYIVKATVEQTGGKIWFKSKENKGSTFYFTIPLSGMKKKEGSRRLE